ncbi:hypothetical protein UA08_00957 [Talaromyces atroroseus]|uniref:Signal peptidase complex catalytic subunit SEC11 n=1 Tax=Talaromyces atroroseus TaxID=1441469 RepID=A0A225AVI0_TALAT|nr:hypothetical protein UA08_00957 [Talaromyces atroroseus]OKL63623.1 hypothetical protein UA08_00957 [Talaromyces atroroseus]
MHGKIRVLLTSALSFLLGLSFPLMAWKALSILTASPYPIMCVISESMAPAFHRGDLLILWNRSSYINVGDIPVVWFAGNPYPMVHRAIQVYHLTTDAEQDHGATSRQFILTKGDNNQFMDVPLYPPGREFVSRDEVVGLVRGYVPLVGWLVICLHEVVWGKYFIFLLVFCYSLFG